MIGCATCVGACCARRWKIAVRADEAERFGSAVVPCSDLGPGYVGELAKGPDGACIYLGRDGCSVYQKRPEVCRRWEAGPGCGYVPDPLKQLGLVRLRD